VQRFNRLLALVLLLFPAFAAAAPIEPSLPAVLTVAQSCPDFTALPAGIPEPVPMSCTAQQSCPSGGTVSCVGNTTCTVQSTSVTCDGVVTSCPSGGCQAPPSCADPQGYCECRASGYGIGYCARGLC
jgi:hypothetical protein